MFKFCRKSVAFLTPTEIYARRKKRLYLSNEAIVSEWLENGKLNTLPSSEQRVYDVFNYMLNNDFTYEYQGNCDLFFAADTNRTSLSVGYYIPLSVRKDCVSLSVELPEAIKGHIIKVLLGESKRRRREAIDRDWPLPTKWDKPKKKGK